MDTDNSKVTGKQIHIISAGRGMIETFKTALNKYHIGIIVIFKEDPIKGKFNKESEDEINQAIAEIKRISSDIGIIFTTRLVRQDDMNEVRDKVLELKNEYPTGEFFFNLTHGRKVLPLFLMTMAVWLDGIPYYIDREQHVMEFNIPRMHAAEISANPNYITILGILSKAVSGNSKFVRYKEVFEEVSKTLIPKDSQKAGRPGRLHVGTFSKWIRRLVDSQLIEQRFEKGSYKTKVLSITNDGVFTYKFMQSEMIGNTRPTEDYRK